MATDAQGRLLSDDGNYYWDGSNWQLVSASGGDGATSSQSPQVTPRTDAQGRQLSEDGNYYWDGSSWQLVNASGGAGAAASGGAAGAGGAATGGNGATADTGSHVSADDIMTGAHVVSTAAELLEIFGKLPEALGAWVEPIGGLITIIDMVYNTIMAMGTAERGAGFRGTAYGTVYGALGMGVPSATCHGSTLGAGQDELDQKAFDEGAREAVSKVSDPVSKNRVIVRIAHDGDPGKTVSAIYQHLCSESGDRELAAAYADNLSWPGPVCA